MSDGSETVQAQQTSGPARRWHRVAWTLGVFFAALAGYWGSAVSVGWTDTPVNSYFDHLAKNFLQGRLYLADPPGTFDLTQHQGRWYVPFPPLAAVLMMPWQALVGRVNTVAFSILLGAVAVAAIYRLTESLRARGLSAISHGDSLWLTLLFGFGCVHYYMAIAGTVWLTAQTTAATFAALAAWAAAGARSPWLSGAALAAAMLGRPHLVALLPMLLALSVERPLLGSRLTEEARRWLLRAGVPLGAAVLMLMAYNYARFGNPLDFGYYGQNVYAELYVELHRYGQFSYHFVPRNVEAMLLELPRWDGARDMYVPDARGMSLLLTTPALLYLAYARGRSVVVRAGWLSTLLILLPLLTYYNTGWRQFGYRFSLDLMIPVLLLLATAAPTRFPTALKVLILLGVGINSWGTWWFFTEPLPDN